MKSKVLLNKSEKKKRIEIAALKLFSCHDVNKISIDQIVQEAGVAKGTFYLYFHDKVQLINHLIVKESSSIINEALQEAKRQNIDDKIDELIFLIDHVIGSLISECIRRSSTSFRRTFPGILSEES